MNLFTEVFMICYLVVKQFELIFAYWILGVIAGSLLSVFATVKIAKAALVLKGRKLKWLSIPFAALLGAASPICMYGTIPLIASLGRKEVPQYVLAAFMVSSILINPNLFIFSFVLGAPTALVRLLVCILAGSLAGVLASMFFYKENLFDFSGFEEKKKCTNESSQVRLFLSDLNRGIVKTAPYFLIGILLTALFERYFPKDLILMMFGNNQGFGVLLAASLGIPVYVCGGGTIPLLKAWMDAGMSPGSAMAFMITGPATKLTNLSAVKIILGIRNFILYIGFNILFAIITGLTVDWIYSLIG